MIINPQSFLDIRCPNELGDNKLRVKMSIPKNQFKEYWQETQPSNVKVIDLFVRTKDREDLDFDELIIEVDIAPRVIQQS